MTYNRPKPKRNEEHGVDDWLMTYADMITLLICFFAVFLSVSVPKKDVFERAREKVLEQFAAENVVADKFPAPAPKSQTGDIYDALPSILDMQHTGEGQTAGDGVQSGQDMRSGQGPEAAPDKGDLITTIEMPSAAFFGSGSADLSDEGKTLLSQILEEKLSAADLQGYIITVEGHTDDVPIKTLQFPSNWELSTARAAAVVRYFIEKGIPPQRLRASGYADSFPKTPNRDEAGKPIPDNQAQNRRVVIKLERIVRKEGG